MDAVEILCEVNEALAELLPLTRTTGPLGVLNPALAADLRRRCQGLRARIGSLVATHLRVTLVPEVDRSLRCASTARWHERGGGCVLLVADGRLLHRHTTTGDYVTVMPAACALAQAQAYVEAQAGQWTRTAATWIDSKRAA